MKIKTKDIILIALFASLTAISGFINIRIATVPVTLQLFFCSFAGIILGARLGSLSQVIYVVIGLVGIPVFAQGGGPGYIFNPTFGYLIGFIVASYLIGKVADKFNDLNIINLSISIFSGLVADYLIGITYFYFIYNFYLGKLITFQSAIIIMLPYIAKDIILGFVVAVIVNRMLPMLKASELA